MRTGCSLSTLDQLIALTERRLQPIAMYNNRVYCCERERETDDVFTFFSPLPVNITKKRTGTEQTGTIRRLRSAAIGKNSYILAPSTPFIGAI